MKRYCIIYDTGKGAAEYWINAISEQTARSIFNNDWKAGNLDEPCRGILKVTEEN